MRLGNVDDVKVMGFRWCRRPRIIFFRTPSLACITHWACPGAASVVMTDTIEHIELITANITANAAAIGASVCKAVTAVEYRWCALH